ncbi:hypothetical protein [Halorientalis salina]|uniref:hypothetical protein n=1 Tax=Halorientalis salina TaxID=2932266 RepID=UPI00145D9B49|nr:hypothetical protein [Halorientalis salina]
MAPAPAAIARTNTLVATATLGGPDNLQATATVDAITLNADEGEDQYVNTPAVVWLEHDTILGIRPNPSCRRGNVPGIYQ